MYLELPTDRVFNKIPRSRLDTPLIPTPQITDLHAEDFVLGEIQKLVEKAGAEVVILVDACAIRHGVMEEVWELIQRTGFPVYSTPMGKTAVPEDYERFGGVCHLCVLPLVSNADIYPTDLCRFNLTSRSQGKGRECKTYSLYWRP